MCKNLNQIYDEFASGYDENRAVFDMTEVVDSFYKLCGDGKKRLLDLGCGAGVPFAQYFAGKGWDVTGVDFSGEMIKLARKYVPEMKAVRADMRELVFDEGSFDEVTAIYSLFHIPSSEQFKLLRKVYGWLSPGGRVLFTYATKEYTGSDEFDGYMEFMGQELYYSHRTPEVLFKELGYIGFEILSLDYREIGGETFLWVSVGR